MGILSIHRNLLSNCKSQLKYLSSSSNLWFIRRISSPAGLSKAQSHAPTGDLKSNNKLMFLIEHFHNESGTYNAWESLSRFPPYNYSIVSAENSWKDHHDLGNPFSGFGNYILAGSCNQLMLFYLYNMDIPFSGHAGHGEYLLWNPTIDKIKILPPRGPNFTNIQGFGFDSKSEDYKVIRFPLYYDDEEIDHEVKLYSLKTNSWKKISHPWWDFGDPLQKHRVHVNGVYYWGTILSTSAIILSFDFANEKFSSTPYIPRPPKFDDNFVDDSVCFSKERFFVDFLDDFVLVEFDGLLAALVHSKLSKSTTEEEPFSFEVWGWNGESWLERKSRTTIDVPGGVVKVVGLFQNDKLFLQGFNNGELLLFDLAESKMEYLGIRADPHMVNIFPFNVRSSIPFIGNK